MTGRARRLLTLLFILVSITALAACSSDASPSPSPTATTPASSGAPASPTATSVPATAAPAAKAEPDGDRILGTVHQLATVMGPRTAGSKVELDAANYLAGKLRELGYDVRLQDFSATSPRSRDSILSITGPSTDTIPSTSFDGGGTATAAGALIAAGKGTPAEFPSSVRGAIALIERGDLLFKDKVNNAIAAGATGVVIYNNEPGAFFGTFDPAVAIPAVSIAQVDGKNLMAQLEKGAVQARISVSQSSAVSHNVIATPPGSSCETVSGGHYDSVPQAPGANDNGSGTATVLEIAGILAKNGAMGHNCFVLFGAEESGLLGSRAYVESLDAAARDRIKAMLNFDMVGVGDEGWQLIGTADLQAAAQAVVAELGIQAARTTLASTGASSDHASFIARGIPALMFYRSNDTAWHTPQDTTERIQAEYLEQAAQMGLAMLAKLTSGT